MASRCGQQWQPTGRRLRSWNGTAPRLPLPASAPQCTAATRSPITSLLQREYALWVADHEGRLVGARALPIREVTIDRRSRRYAYSHFARVHPDYQGIGLFQPLNASTMEGVQAGIDGVFAYVDPANDTPNAALGGYATWSARPFRAELDCARLAGPAFGRQAGPADAERIVELLNACHMREGFFAPYTVTTLEERLSRAFDVYSWGNFCLSDAAVVGMWSCGERRTVVDGGRKDISVRGLVLDYGFCPAAGLTSSKR